MLKNDESTKATERPILPDDLRRPRSPTTLRKRTQKIPLEMCEKSLKRDRRAEKTRVSISPEGLEFLRDVLRTFSGSSTDRTLLETVSSSGNATVDEVRGLRDSGSSIASFVTSFRFGETHQPPPSAYTLKRRAFLLSQHQKREYKRMTADVSNNTFTTISPEHSGRGESTTTGNMLRKSAVPLNMAIGSVSAFFSARYLCRAYGLHEQTTTLLSSLALVAVLMVEMILFVLRAFRVDEADAAKRKKIESAPI